ncbi:MAG: Flp pilus assembly complex ATPase component TadA [Burkholderiales bacterium]|jgi:general secretion pathway protein E|nr:Flp pilus assembly complex ATPase component TadA [Burkholderiales bacterium]
MNDKAFTDHLIHQTSSASVRLGERLLERGLLTPRQFQYALQKQSVENLRFGTLLVKHGLAQEYHVAKELAAEKDIPFLTHEEFPVPDPDTFTHFNRELCLLNSFLPIRRVGDGLEVLLGDSDEAHVAELVMHRTGLTCRFLQGEFTQVSQYIREIFYFSQHSIESLLELEVRRLAEDVDHAYSPEKFLDYLLHKAAHQRATDIHLSPSSSSLHLFFRVDGVLRPVMALPLSLMRLVVYIKLLAEMDISEQRRPQDGSFHMPLFDQPFAIRVSVLCSEYGERVVMRLLPERSKLAGLEQLGFLKNDVVALERIFSKPSGMILITGPTGSGKSTTMYAALQFQSLVESNVLTVEDPIEYRVPGAAQTEVNRRAGYDFSNALRFFLRHDSDVILIGEIRDKETALAAIEAAATGHLVLSTLHVGSAFGVVPRLRPLGLDAQMIADNLIAVISQRLVRRNCPYCSEEDALTAAEKTWLGGGKIKAFRGRGCDVCGFSGYFGRLPVYEILEVDQSLANAIADNAGRENLRLKAEGSGFTTILDQAKWRVCHGQTTLDEIRRVVGEGVAG